MDPLLRLPPRVCRWFGSGAWTLVLLLLAGCANGDFGRVRPSLVSDDMHSWIGTEAVGSIGKPASRYALNDDERQLRDLAYPLIEPPFDRQRWDSVLGEYGGSRAFRRDWALFDTAGYSRELMAKPFRSATGRYARLIDDIRNDSTRIEPFFMTARHVLDMDSKREQSLHYIPELQESERINALSRINENRLVISWVHRSLTERATAYRFALERLVIANPSPMAVEAERVLNRLRMQIEKNRLVPLPQFSGAYASARPRIAPNRAAVQ
jgi:hypothetical protein